MTNKSSSKRIEIYDTSLRDGMQGMHISYTLEDKLQIAKEIDKFKIDYIEGGFPLSNDKESEFFKQVKKLNLKHSKIVSFGSTRRPESNINTDLNIQALLEAETEVVTLVAKSSLAHVKYVLKTTPKENLKMTFESIKFLKDRDLKVILDLEHFFDGYKINTEYAIQILQTGTDAGADVLVLCDTNGGTLTHEVRTIIQSLPQPKLAPLGLHFHDDCGIGVANSLEGIANGGIQIQGTINGWGERAGNANLATIIPHLILKDSRFTANCKSTIHTLTSLSRFMAEKSNIIPYNRQPFVGHAAFSHKAGQHADVIIKNASLMEHLTPEEVGNERHIILSELAGKSTIVSKLSKYGNFTKKDRIVGKLINTLKKKETQGYEYETAEASFELEMRKELNLYSPLFELKNYHLELFKNSKDHTNTTCRIFLYLNNQEVMGAAVGNGPVDTLDKAVRNAIEEIYPAILKVKLTDYKVRVLNPERGTSAKVRVLITSSTQDKDWSTIGVHENVVEASWEAMIDSYEYYSNVIMEKKARK